MLRIGFDLDGVLADFAGACARLAPGRQEPDWRAVRAAPDFWTTLQPLEPGVVRRIQADTVRYRWDTFFVTQRFDTAGDTVQRQSQRWLADQGFSWPSVIVHSGARGKLAAALGLDFLVDDTVEHCVNVLDDSRAQPILIGPEADPVVEINAQRLGITICRTVSEALEVIELAAQETDRPNLLRRVTKHIGL